VYLKGIVRYRYTTEERDASYLAHRDIKPEHRMKLRQGIEDFRRMLEEKWNSQDE